MFGLAASMSLPPFICGCWLPWMCNNLKTHNVSVVTLLPEKATTQTYLSSSGGPSLLGPFSTCKGKKNVMFQTIWTQIKCKQFKLQFRLFWLQCSSHAFHLFRSPRGLTPAWNPRSNVIGQRTINVSKKTSSPNLLSCYQILISQLCW